MLVGHIDGATRQLGRSQGYRGLPIRDEVEVCGATNEKVAVMHSVWEPTPQELERLNNGGKIQLSVHGIVHPPVRLEVTEPPK